MRVLYLMRHAEAESFAPSGDKLRRLTDYGRLTAELAGSALQDSGVEAVLCSSATRAAQTAAYLGLSVQPEPIDALYNSDPERLLAVIHELPEEITTALVVAHAPGLPNLALDLSRGTDSDPVAVASIANRFPAGTVVRLETEEEWSELRSARLASARLPE